MFSSQSQILWGWSLWDLTGVTLALEHANSLQSYDADINVDVEIMKMKFGQDYEAVFCWDFKTCVRSKLLC